MPDRPADLPVAAPAQHAFDGRVNQWCSYRGPLGAKCGKPANDPVHRIAWKVSSPSDLPVAAPDPAATARRAAQWVEDRGVYLTPRGGLSPLPPGGADTRVVYAYADAFALALVALLVERQQDKERIENVEDIARAGISWAPPDHKRQLTERLDAALAVEEDARPGKPETPGNSGAAVEEDATP